MFLPATCQESDCSWASFGSFVNCGVIMISSNNLCLLYSDFVTTEGAITSNALRPTYVTQKGSPSRTPGGGDARVYTTPNIRVFPNMGLCRQRFSAIDGIQVIARFFFFKRVHAVLWGEPVSCGAGPVSASQGGNRQAFPWACWPRMLVPTGRVLASPCRRAAAVQMPHRIQKQHSLWGRSGVVERDSQPGQDFSSASIRGLEWNSYSLTLMVLLLFFNGTGHRDSLDYPQG